MCFSGSTPTAPVNRPTYKPEDASKFFDLSKTDATGKVTDLDGRSEEENKKATGIKF